MTGIRTSISTTSGRCSRHSRTASAPSRGGADDLEVRLGRRAARRSRRGPPPGRRRRRCRITAASRRSRPIGSVGLDEEAAGRAPARAQRAADRRGPLAHAEQAVPAGAAVPAPARAVVADAQPQRVVGVVAARRRRPRRARAGGRWSAPPGRSGRRRARRPGRARRPAPLHDQPGARRRRVPRLVEQLVSCVEARLGRARRRGVVGVLAQHAEQPAHLGQRRPRGVADRGAAAARPRPACPASVSRAVSACTEIIEMWWATTSCSSRAIRARSPRAVCSSELPADSSTAARGRRAASRAARRPTQPAPATSAASGDGDARGRIGRVRSARRPRQDRARERTASDRDQRAAATPVERHQRAR